MIEFTTHFAKAVLAILFSLGSFVVSPVLGGGTGTLNQLDQWNVSGGNVKLASSTASIRVPFLANCDTIDSDGNGVFSCGSDASGGAGGSGFSTTSTDYYFTRFRDWALNTNGKLAPTTTKSIAVNGSATSTFSAGLEAPGIGSPWFSATSTTQASLFNLLTVATTFTLAGQTGCATFSAGVLSGTGSACGSSSGLTSYDAWTHPSAGQSATTSLMKFTNTGTTTFSGGLEANGIGAPWFSATSTSATSTFQGGINAASLRLTPTTNKFLYTGNDGLVVGAASSSLSLPNTALQNSTISGISLGGTLGALTAGNTSLTFSGSYDGSAARTVTLTSRTINGTAFDGTSNITITAASSTLLSDTNLFSTSGTTTFSNGVAVGNFAQTGTATSTLNRGITLASGCYAVQNACLSLSTLPGTISLTTQVTGDLPFANLAQVAAASVLGNPTGSTADAQSLATSTLFGGAITPGYVLTSTGSGWTPMATATCLQITGSAGLCDGDDATGAGGSSSDPFTHPALGQSATTSLLILNGNASTTALSVFNKAFFGATATTTVNSIGQIDFPSTNQQSTSTFMTWGGRSLLNASSSDTGSTGANFFFGLESGSRITSGFKNTGFGHNALANARNASSNTAIGYASLYSTVDGIDNVAVGPAVLYSNTGGSDNTGVGAGSVLAFNTTGANNTAIGYATLNSNTIGISNTAVGQSALVFNDTGDYNTGIGYNALWSNTSGRYNSAFGMQAGYDITTGSDNILIGHTENTGGNAITTGGGNIGLGYNIVFPSSNSRSMLNIGNFIFAKLPATTTATTLPSSFNGAVGIATTSPFFALTVASSAAPQFALADASLTSNAWTMRSISNSLYISTSSPSTFATSTVPAIWIDPNGLVTFGRSNATCIALTGSAGLCDGNDATGGGGGIDYTAWGGSIANNFGTSTIASTTVPLFLMGFHASSTAQLSDANFFGRINFATSSNTATSTFLSINGRQFINASSSIFSTFLGLEAGSNVTNGSATDNTGIGYQALQRSTTASDNTAVGMQAMQGGAAGITGAANTALGAFALQAVTTGYQNDAIGWSALSLLTTGHDNEAIGQQSLTSLSSGYKNIGVGGLTGGAISTGFNNTLIGYNAGGSITTGGSNTFIGQNAGFSLTLGSSTILIGNQVDATSTTATRFLNIGNVLYGNGMYSDCCTNSSSPTADGRIGIGTTTPWGQLSINANTNIDPSFVVGNSSKTHFLISNDGKVGVGTSTPWGLLSIASSSPDYITPLFTIGTTSDATSTGDLVSVFATSTTLSSNVSKINPLISLADSGVRFVIGAFQKYQGLLLDQLNINGRINTGEWFSNICSGAGGLVNPSADAANQCGEWQYQVDTSGTASFSQTPVGMIVLNNTTAQTNSGSGFFAATAGNTTGGFLKAATNTPSLEFAITGNVPTGAVNTLSTTTIYAGFNNINPQGSTFETAPTIGCYITASSSINNFFAVCQTSATAVTQFDTRWSSSTPHMLRFRIDLDNAQAKFYIQTPTTTMRLLTTMSGANYSATTFLNAGIYISRGGTAGTAASLGVSYMKLWFRKTLWPN